MLSISDAVLPLSAEVPALLHHQGRVLVGGAPADGPAQFKFAFVNADASAVYWSNAPDAAPADGEPDQAVTLTLDRGLYSVLLGDVTQPHMAAIPPEVFQHAEVYLSIWFDDGTGAFRHLLPDRRVAATAYALTAATVTDGAITADKLAPDALGALPSQVADLTAQVGALQTQLNDQADLIADLQTTVAQQADQIAALQDQVAALSLPGGGGLVSGLTAASMQTSDTGLLGLGFEPFSSLTAPGWRDGGSLNAPSPRSGHVAVWTGQTMIVWGGEISPGWVVGTGAMYDPDTDAWQTVSTVESPTARSAATAVWSGAEMIVWGGAAGGSFLNSGGRFDPTTQRWTALPSGPTGRVGHVAVWTGNRLLIWGGRNAAGLLNHGALFDPGSGTWTTLNVADPPAPRTGAAAVWTGDRLLVWGGEGSAGVLADGAALRFDATGQPLAWETLSSAGAPSARKAPSAVWTGDRLLLWGGEDAAGNPLGDGAAYNPTTDTWEALSTLDAPTPRTGQVALWSGQELLIVTGATTGGNTADGAAYDPDTDRWRALSAAGNPLARRQAAGVWTGTELLLFGGRAEGRRVAALQRLIPQPTWYLYRKP